MTSLGFPVPPGPPRCINSCSDFPFKVCIDTTSKARLCSLLFRDAVSDVANYRFCRFNRPDELYVHVASYSFQDGHVEVIYEAVQAPQAHFWIHSAFSVKFFFFEIKSANSLLARLIIFVTRVRMAVGLNAFCETAVFAIRSKTT